MVVWCRLVNGQLIRRPGRRRVQCGFCKEIIWFNMVLICRSLKRHGLAEDIYSPFRFVAALADVPQLITCHDLTLGGSNSRKAWLAIAFGSLVIAAPPRG